MKRPSIKLALIAIFALFAVLFSGTAYFSLNGVKTLNASTTNFASNVLPSILAAKDIQLARLQLRGGYEDHVVASTPEAMATAAAAITTKERDLNAAIKAYAPLISSDYERASYTSLLPLLEPDSKRTQ